MTTARTGSPLVRSMALGLALLAVAAVAAAPPSLSFTFIDVGEGDSTLIETSSGYSLLVDTGSPLAEKKVASVLRSRSRNARTLSALILTHPHMDHMGGVFSVLDAFNPSLVADNGQPMDRESADNDMYRWYQTRVRTRPSYRVLCAPASWRAGDVTFTVLWPPSGDLTPDWNNNSIVLRVDFGQFHALLMGDALRDTAEAIVPQLGPGRVTLVKAGHHASTFSESARFIDAANPAATVVSVDRDNVRGYPSAAVIERYRAHGPVYRTDTMGTIRVKATAAGTFTVSTERAR